MRVFQGPRVVQLFARPAASLQRVAGSCPTARALLCVRVSSKGNRKQKNLESTLIYIHVGEREGCVFWGKKRVGNLAISLVHNNKPST